jgi:hypothetical protein
MVVCVVSFWDSRDSRTEAEYWPLERKRVLEVRLLLQAETLDERGHTSSLELPV